MGKMNQKALSGGEYALMLGLVSLTLVAGFETVSSQNQETLNKIKDKIEQITSSFIEDGDSENIIIGALPGHLEPAVPPSQVSYLYNVSKEPTAMNDFQMWLTTGWLEKDYFGSDADRYDLTADSSFPELTYAIGVSSDMNCNGSAGDYCWTFIRGDNLTSESYNGDKITIIGDRVGLIDFSNLVVGLTSGAHKIFHVEVFANDLVFAPVVPYWRSGLSNRLQYRIDANGSTVYLVNNSFASYQIYQLEDGIFDVIKPHSEIYFEYEAALGLYEYIPSEGGVVNIYYVPGPHGNVSPSNQHLINMSTVSNWTSNCYSIDGKDVVKLTNPDNGYDAVFNFHRTPTFSGALNASCNFADSNTFVQ